MTQDEILPIFIGYDTREHDAYQVCKSSILKHATRPVYIQPLNERSMRHAAIYKRRWRSVDGQKVDEIDGKPFSTEFSFTRFLVPSMCQWQGWAVFVDCDFLFMTDITDIVKEFDNRYAVMVCKQNYQPKTAVKMDGQSQQSYNRKNWSSLAVFNCAHASNHDLTPFRVNKEFGSYLHGFSWLEDHEIGDLNHGWNWLEGCTQVPPKAVHYTLGGPWFPDKQDVAYAKEWLDEARRIGVGP
jgi:hypothetical protein